MPGSVQKPMIHRSIHLPREALAEFCRRRRIKQLSLFGSAARGDFGPTSDIDLLVDFEEDANVSAFDLVRMQEELEALFGRKVDLAGPNVLRNPYRRRTILKDLQPIYAA